MVFLFKSFLTTFTIRNKNMKVLVCPDKFKGSLTADEVCNAIQLGLKNFDQSVEVVKLPLADGGEGTLDLLETVLDLKREHVAVNDPLSRTITTYYLRNDSTAFIEMAKASGLQLLANKERNPLHTSTFGTGQLIAHALDQGVDEIFLLIGGSATNDGGVGMAHALGFEFLTEDGGNRLINGAGLSQLTRIVEENRHGRLKEVKFTVLSDVKNPLLGTNGASHVYGRQKGADESAIVVLEEGLMNLARLLNNGVKNIPGAGAAGGLGYGAMSFLNAKIESGIETIMKMVDFERHIMGVDLIITGEGKLDGQTNEGKVVMGVVDMAGRYNIPVGIICGIQDGSSMAIDPKLIYQVKDLAKNFEDSMANADGYVKELAFQLISDLQ